METVIAHIGKLNIGRGLPIVPQTMCNTHTFDVSGTVAQCVKLHNAGALMIRITVPGASDVEHIREISSRLRAQGIDTPLVADIHFSSETAIAVAPFVEKVRINPGNFHRDHEEACRQLARLIEVCKACGTAIRIGINHGSLGERITSLYGNTPNAMCRAALEWIQMCEEHNFQNLVISLKASNTLVMTEAYRLLNREMIERGRIYPLHLGVTEAGNGDAGRIKSCVGISALLEDGIGDTVRVSLTEDPANELPAAVYLARRYSPKSGSMPKVGSFATDFESNRIVNVLNPCVKCVEIQGNKAVASYEAPSWEDLLFEVSCDLGKKLLDREIDDVELHGGYLDSEGKPVGLDGEYLRDELLQACRRRFYRPEYIACPGCGRTMYGLEEAFEAVKARTSHLKGMVIAVMGCIVNGPGEMADADWGYVGEGNHKVSIYKGHTPLLRHIPDTEAVDCLLRLIEENST